MSCSGCEVFVRNSVARGEHWQPAGRGDLAVMESWTALVSFVVPAMESGSEIRHAGTSGNCWLPPLLSSRCLYQPIIIIPFLRASPIHFRHHHLCASGGQVRRV